MRIFRTRLAHDECKIVSWRSTIKTVVVSTHLVSCVDIISGDEDMSDGEENTAPPVQAAAPQNPPAEPATQPASSDVRTERHQDACIHSGH